MPIEVNRPPSIPEIRFHHVPGQSGTCTALRYDTSPVSARSMGFGLPLKDVRFIAHIGANSDEAGEGERGR